MLVVEGMLDVAHVLTILQYLLVAVAAATIASVCMLAPVKIV